MRIRVLDLGIGNLHSLQKALRAIAPKALLDLAPPSAAPIAAELIVLPGVGAFTSAASELERCASALRAALSSGSSLLGICLGMQLLFERSAEGAGRGLGILRGDVVELSGEPRPHMGFSRVTPRRSVDGLALPSIAYYAHSFHCRARDPQQVVATTRCGDEEFSAVVRAGRVVGCQFHPEKSSRAGLDFLESVVSEAQR